jgi:hypothetical protein
MPVYSIDKFLNSKLSEEITYTPSGSDGVIIRACVNRRTMSQHSSQHSDRGINYYPISVVISKSDIDTIKENEDKITLPDITGKMITTRVKKIIMSDTESWELGA